MGFITWHTSIITYIIDGETADDQFLTHRKDLIFYGLHYQARALCVQYGDGITNNFFWRSDLYWFNLLRKVGTLWKFYFKEFSFQYKYRIESCEKSAAAQGVHGRAMGVATTWECFANDVGARNTNKAGDLKVWLPSISFCQDCNCLRLSTPMTSGSAESPAWRVMSHRAASLWCRGK